MYYTFVFHLLLNTSGLILFPCSVLVTYAVTINLNLDLIWKSFDVIKALPRGAANAHVTSLLGIWC